MEITPAPFSLAAVLTDAADAVRPDADARGLTLTLTGDLDPAARRLGDARRVRQVLGHLLSNAVKFTERGGVELTVAADGQGVTLTIADTGSGLDEALLADLFEPFSQADASTSRRHDGAGMGLALSRRLADLMGGAVTGANRPSGGAVFTLSLPLPSVEPAVVVLPAADPASEPDDARAPRILVVDDHPTNREVARLMLASFGCEVAMACDGLEAVAAMGAGRFDLVLMDVRMPRMDGLEATRAIRALPGPAGATAIVAMTADTMPEDVARCLAAGMNAHQAKPVSLAGLGAILERFLGDPDAEAELAA